jgi:hypothetical protein
MGQRYEVMRTARYDSDIVEDGCEGSESSCSEGYVLGWSVALRLREEIALSKLKSRLEALLSATNVPILSAIFFLSSHTTDRAAVTSKACKSLYLALSRVRATYSDQAATFRMYVLYLMLLNSGQMYAACRLALAETQSTSCPPAA